MPNTIETSIAYIEHPKPDLIKIRVKKNVSIDHKGLEENLAAFKHFLGTGKAKFLTKFHALNTADVGIRSEYESAQRVQIKLAEAFVIESLSNRIELTYHIKNAKKFYPIKIFNDEMEGLKWLESLDL